MTWAKFGAGWTTSGGVGIPTVVSLAVGGQGNLMKVGVKAQPTPKLLPRHCRRRTTMWEKFDGHQITAGAAMASLVVTATKPKVLLLANVKSNCNQNTAPAL